MTFKIFTLFLIVSLASAQGMYTLALHSHDRGAACLDGSPAGLYYHEGTGSNRNSYLIYLDSGGFCEGMNTAETIQSCYKRSSGSLGTTKNYPAQKNMDKLGLLSTLKQNNPVFYDWTKVFVIYCDGSEYTGSRKQPISYKDKQLYFRGYNNILEQFYFLDQKFDFYNGNTIVLTGVSAGGIGTYFYSNYLVQNTKTSKVYAIPDSGLFITDYYSPIVGAQVMKIMGQSLFKLINTDEVGFPFMQCFQQFKNDIIQCYNPANLAKYFKAPMFIVQSAYDQYALNMVIVAQCVTNKVLPYSIQTCNSTTRQAIQNYRKLTIDALNTIRGNRTDVGLWSPSCVQHGFTDMSSFTNSNYQIPSVNGPMVHQAISQFLANPNQAKWYLDLVPWPYNTGCNGLNNSNLRTQ